MPPNLMIKKTLYLTFSHSYGAYGSKEHFCHFLWGYALPGLHRAISFLSTQNYTEWRIVVDDCGPIMNKTLKELFDALNLEVSFRNLTDNTTKEYDIERWDIMLHEPSIMTDDEYSQNPHIQKFRNNPFLRASLRETNSMERLKGDILNIRNKCLSAVDNFELENTTDYLIIKRSSEPHFYSEDGQAEIKGYGVSRRSLIDVDDFVEYLRSKGVKVNSYEPGAHSITHQIKTFNKCKGIIAIRGAECSNAIWMQEHSKLIIVTPRTMQPPPIYKRICNIVDIEYYDIAGVDQNQLSLFDYKECIEGIVNDKNV